MPSSLMSNVPHPFSADRSDHDVACLSVFDGVIHGFLRNVIEMRRHGVVVDQHGCFAFEAAGNSEQIFYLSAPRVGALT